MAAIGQIRKHYGLLVVIIGVAMAAFIMGDLFKSRTRQSVNIGAVNGEEISYKDFSVEVEKAQDAEKTNKKKAQLNSSEVFRIKQNTWKRMVKDIIMKDELDELGLTVTSDELYDLVQGEHPHRYILQYFKDPATGQYKPEMVRQYLQNLDKMPRENQLQWIDFEKAIKEDQLNTKFNNLVAKAYYLPKEFAKMVDAHKSTEVEVQYVAQLYSSVNDDKVSVTDADYQKYYDEHKEDFKREETRDVDYVVFDVKPTADDRKAQKRKFDEYYSELKTIDLVEVPVFVNSISDTKYADKWFKQGELPLQIDQTMFHSEPGATVAPYMSNNAYHCAILLDKQNRPDSLKASHILIAYSGATGASESVTRIKPQAKSLADSLLKVLQKNPNKIEELAIALSDDPGVKQNKGHYDWFADGRMVPEFNQACLDNKKGSVVVVETVYGFHVIRVDGQKDYSDKVKVAMVDRAIEPSNQTYQQVYVKANEFASKCKSSNFDDVAEEMGLSKRTLSDLTAMQETIPGQKDGRQIVIWAYKPDRALNDLNLFDMNGSYLVTTLSNIKEKGYASLDEVKQNISSAVKNTKKGDYIIDQINKSANKENLVQLASEIHTAVDTTTITFETSNIPGFGPEFDVIGAAAAMTKGEFLGPIKGSKAVFVMKAIDYRPATAKTSYKALIDQMNNRFKSAVNFRLYNAIEKQADIEDNRHTFY
jgi:peptidyl-prolyl cis-trans isomerase D